MKVQSYTFIWCRLEGSQVCFLLLGASRTEDNRCMGLVMWKQVVGEHWRRLFRGDPDGARCMPPPYQLTGGIGQLHAWLCFQVRKFSINNGMDRAFVWLQNPMAMSSLRSTSPSGSAPKMWMSRFFLTACICLCAMKLGSAGNTGRAGDVKPHRPVHYCCASNASH